MTSQDQAGGRSPAAETRHGWFPGYLLSPLRSGKFTYASILRDGEEGADSSLGVLSRQELISRFAEFLVGQLGVFNAWIALTDGRGITDTASSFPDGFQPLRDLMAQGHCPFCYDKALKASGVVVIYDSASTCRECPLAGNYKGRSGLSCRIEHDGIVFGVLSVSAPEHMADDQLLHDQFTMMAADLGRMLHQVEQAEQHRRVEESLRKSEALLDATQTLAHIGGWEWDATRQFMQWTSEVYRIFDKDPLEIGADSQARMDAALASFDDTDRARIWELFQRCLEQGIEYDYICRITTAQQRTKWVRTTGRPVYRQGVIDGAYGLMQDITDQKAAEEALRESRRRLSSLMDNLPGMAYRCSSDSSWTMEFLSRGCRAVTGYDAERLIGPQALPYNELIHPDDRAMVAEVVGRAVAEGRPFTLEYRIITATGEERWVWERGHAVPEAAASRAPMLEGFISDVTERRQLEQHVAQMQRQESLGTMAAGVAHDFNNLLMAIMGNADMAGSAVEAGHPAHAFIQSIQKTAEQAGSLCRQMLSFCGKGSVTSEWVDVRQLVRLMSPMLSNVIAHNARLEVVDGTDVAMVRADPAELRQVILQLVVNAWESYDGRPGVVRLEIGTSCYDGKPQPSQLPHDEPPSGWYTWVSITDHGQGMTSNTMERMFDPFFSTKFAGRGMGLPSVKGIIRSLNGRLLVTSRPGYGSTFRILIPAAETNQERLRSEAATAVSPAGRPIKNILLVDDEPALRKLGQIMLEKLGYSLVTATDGQEAVEYYRAHPGEVDLVITDLTMPRLDGIEAARQILMIDSGARIILMTGYSENDISSRMETSRLVGVLLKPFRVDDLKRLMESALLSSS